MNALRVAQSAHALSRVAGTSQLRRASTISVVSHSSSLNALPLSNVEAQWEKLSKEEQVGLHRQLEELQKKDWKTLSIDEKRAGALSMFSIPSISQMTIRLDAIPIVCPTHRLAYYVAFGPHGPRTPTSPPGTTVKVSVSVVGAIAAATVLWTVLRSYGTECSSACISPLLRADIVTNLFSRTTTEDLVKRMARGFE